MPGTTPWAIPAFAYGAANIAISTTVEIVLVTLAGINSRSIGQPINLAGWAVITLSANTTAVVLRVRQDSLTGAVVGVASTQSTAQATLATQAFEINVQDASAVEYANKTYVLTASCTAASAGSTAVASALAAYY